jgi:hypothetical protein
MTTCVTDSLRLKGRIVFSVTKEDLVEIEHLDELTRQVLGCANKCLALTLIGT